MALVLIFLLIFCGTLWTFVYQNEGSFAVRLASGTAIGFVVFSYAALLMACAFGLNARSISASLFVVLLPSLWLWLWLWKRHRVLVVREAREGFASWRGRNWKTHLFNVALLALLFFVFRSAMYQKPGGIYTGYVNNLGDSAFHLQITNSFTDGQNFPPEHPVFAGTRFTYHFLGDFLIAVWVKCGLTVEVATLIFNFVLAAMSLTLLRRFAWHLLRDERAARLTPWIVLLGGGTGWWMLGREASESQGGILEILRTLPHTYSLLMPETDWKWGNILTVSLVTQRSFVMGLPLALTVWILWLQVIRQITHREEASETEARRKMVAAGLITGLLPLVHSPSFAISMAVGFCYALLFWRPHWWLRFAAAAIVVALPQVRWLTGAGSKAASFVAWMPGWEKGETGFIVFWLKNTGPFFLLFLLAAFWLWRSKKATENDDASREPFEYSMLGRATLLKLYLPFFLICFVAPNLFKLTPWSWDNIKLMQFWWIVSTPFVAWALVQMWQMTKHGKWWRAAASVCIFSLLAAGALDAWRGVSSEDSFPTKNPPTQIFTRAQMDVAERIKKYPPRSLWLHAPTYNAPTYLTGRRIVMGYAGHVWPHGIDSSPREAEVRSFLAGAPGAEEILKRYGVDYFVVGPQERDYLQSNGMQTPPASHWNRWKKLEDIGEYSIYAAR